MTRTCPIDTRIRYLLLLLRTQSHRVSSQKSPVIIRTGLELSFESLLKYEYTNNYMQVDAPADEAGV
jgi:hypothetical protein